MKTRITFAAVIGVVLLGACSLPFLQLPVKVAPSSVSVSFTIPESLSGAPAASTPSAASRVVDPTTSKIELWLKGTKAGSIGLSSGTRNGASWTGTFAGVTAGTYNAGELVVKLLGASGNLLTSGSNGASVTIPAQGTTSVSIKAVPDASIVTTIVPGTRYSIDLAAGASHYYKLSTAHSAAYSLLFFHPSAFAQIAVFNADGSILANSWDDTQVVGSLWGSNNDHDELWWSSPTDQDCYLGVFPHSVAGAPLKTTLVVADESTAVPLVLYGGSLINDPPDNFGLWEAPSGTTRPVTLEPGGQYVLRFKIFNLTTSNQQIALTGEQPLSLETTDGRITVESQPESSQFDWSNRPEFFVSFDASDPGNSAPADATLTLPYAILGSSATGTYTIPLHFTIGPRTPQIFMYYRNTRIANNATYDLGDVPIRTFQNGSGEYITPQYLMVPFGVFNPGPGTLTLSGGALTGGIMVSTAPGETMSVPPNTGGGGTVSFDLANDLASAAHVGASYTTTLTLTTNAPMLPAITLTATYRMLFEPPYLDALVGDQAGANTTNTVSVMWCWGSTTPVGSATAFRIYRATRSDGPYTLRATVTNDGGVLPAEIAAQLPAGLDRGMVWSDTGLPVDTRYFYKLDAMLPSSPDHTAQSWEAATAATCDRALQDSFEPNDRSSGFLMQAAQLPLDTANNANFYPRGDDDFYTFVPVDGHTYTITVQNVSLIGSAWLAFGDGAGTFVADTRCDATSPTATVTWICPGNYSSTSQKPNINFWADQNCSGDYTITVTDVTPM